ncbi:hypothetical protein DF3PB_3660002 [uncultured Defluviicoccus sp.]|uniref:Uncharacterized protein n=1 Tax=metagenome TaxID=256318 RepID=A0A380THA4_9ZZZZ|nr:hypothetical protein DF3PB_3660002 [uncultured Defluviicoccus sp.]
MPFAHRIDLAVQPIGLDVGRFVRLGHVLHGGGTANRAGRHVRRRHDVPNRQVPFQPTRKRDCGLEHGLEHLVITHDYDNGFDRHPSPDFFPSRASLARRAAARLTCPWDSVSSAET